mgnify:CR=1 FL=1
MVLQQRVAMTDPNAPAASIEAILHAILPFKFVDHSHANAISALTCAAMQPEEASAVEREASRLGAVLWASDTVPAQRPATPLRDGARIARSSYDEV